MPTRKAKQVNVFAYLLTLTCYTSHDVWHSLREACGGNIARPQNHSPLASPTINPVALVFWSPNCPNTAGR